MRRLKGNNLQAAVRNFLREVVRRLEGNYSKCRSIAGLVIVIAKVRGWTCRLFCPPSSWHLGDGSKWLLLLFAIGLSTELLLSLRRTARLLCRESAHVERYHSMLSITLMLSDSKTC